MEIRKAGKALSEISAPDGEDYVEAIFSDGTRVRGTTLLGADGGGSTVRRIVCGTMDDGKADCLPYEMMNVYSTYDPAVARRLKAQLHPLIDIGIHPKGMYCRVNALDIQDLDRPETWKFQILATWPQSDDEESVDKAGSKLEKLKAQFVDWCDPHKTAVMNLRPDTVLYQDNLRQWKPTQWETFGGRVTLAGDAAHASTFRKYDGDG